MEKAERLISIIMILLKKDVVTTKEFAQNDRQSFLSFKMDNVVDRLCATLL
ncbi:hypothetical protein D3C76_468330 [compost metagenome]